MKITKVEKRGRQDISIKLDSWETRRIWYIKWVNYHVKRNPDRHLFYKNNSYAFSYDMLMMLPETYNVVVNEGSHMYVLVASVWDILKHNDYKYFKAQGFELQVFYPKSLFRVDLYKKFVS